MALHSFDTPIKRRVRAEYRAFLKRTILRDKKPSEVQVLCLPGHEAIEIFDVYDRLGIPRSNVYGVEYKQEAYEMLVARKLGINVWFGDVFDYLAGNAINRFHEKKLFGKNTLIMDAALAKTPDIPALIVNYETNGLKKEAVIGVDTSVAQVFDDLRDANGPSATFVEDVNKKLSMPSGSWRGQAFDIISLDICGHVTPKVMNGISSCFRSKALNDRGVFTLTSLASREQELTALLIRMGMLMDAMIRGTISGAAENIRPELVKRFGFHDDEARNMIRERTGLEALVLFLASGNTMFFEMLKIYNKALAGTLLLDMPRNNIYDSMFDIQHDETSMIARRTERYVYQSEHSRMRTAFMQFRSAKKAVGETGSMMEVIYALMASLGSTVTEISPLKPAELSKEQIMQRIRTGDFT